MLLMGLISLLIAIPLYSSTITPKLLIRITSILLLYGAVLSFNGLYVQSLGSGLGLYSGLFHVTSVTQTMEIFILIVGSIILTLSSSSLPSKGQRLSEVIEYPMIILFTTMGSLFLISSSDLVSMFLSIELQSFAVYILAAIYRNSESATSAGLKYFLLGALSSALILLGSSLIYAYTGLTQFDSLFMLSFSDNTLSNQSIYNTEYYNLITLLGLFVISIGFMFKVAAAPFHNWAPDVYDGVPTIVTTWLTVMPKIAIFVFLLEITTADLAFLSTGVLGSENNLYTLKSLFLITSLLSLIIGTVLGLAQVRIKRLLAYSTISHVGFLLLALSVNSENSVAAFIFYLIQYSLTNLNVFIIVLLFGFFISNQSNYTMRGNGTDLTFISELKGQFNRNPILSLSFVFCLFSIAGIPPLIGFFAKYLVLFSAIEKGHYFLAIVGILASVISAAYYLRIVRVMSFEKLSTESIISKNNLYSGLSNASHFLGKNDSTLYSIQSYSVAILTLLITFFIFAPSFLLNSSNLLALTLFTA